jgi:hypothetical protein
MTLIYGDVDWYQARPEPERVWTGTLEEHRVGVGPDTRGGLSFVLVTDAARISVYAAKAERRLTGFRRRSVRVRGKLVDLGEQGNGEELWPASIELRT